MASKSFFGGCLVEPDGKPARVQNLERPLPAARVVIDKIEFDARDLGLDGAPKRPADIRHQSEQVHSRELPRVVVAKVSAAECSAQVLIKFRFLGRVAEIEARVVVAAELVIDDAKRLAIVDEVLAQQVVMAGTGGKRANAVRLFDRRDRR